jgi:hypothetical protein
MHKIMMLAALAIVVATALAFPAAAYEGGRCGTQYDGYPGWAQDAFCGNRH